MEIEVVYATPEQQWVVVLALPEGATIADALSRADSGLGDADLKNATVGVFGAVRPRNYVLKDADRVEVYRPLIVEAKEARRRRAADQRTADHKARGPKAHR